MLPFDKNWITNYRAQGTEKDKNIKLKAVTKINKYFKRSIL